MNKEEKDFQEWMFDKTSFAWGALLMLTLVVAIDYFWIWPYFWDKEIEKTEQRVMAEAKKVTCGDVKTELSKCAKELRKHQWEYWDEIEQYAVLSVETICFEEAQDWRELAMSCNDILIFERETWKVNWFKQEWCKENCEMPSEEELERWIEDG